jgi:membrane protein implicated in regulation of membrane protease activity
VADLSTNLSYTFIVAGILLFLWEVSMPGFFIAIPATVLIFLGVLNFAWPGFLTSVWSPLVAVAIAVPATLLTIRFYRRLAPPADRPMTTVGDSLVGLEGTVETEVRPYETRGKVKIKGQVWSATSDEGVIAIGTRVRVLRSEGVHVVVTPVNVPAASL